jgi:hypothetical protein
MDKQPESFKLIHEKTEFLLRKQKKLEGLIVKSKKAEIHTVPTFLATNDRYRIFKSLCILYQKDHMTGEERFTCMRQQIKLKNQSY